MGKRSKPSLIRYKGISSPTSAASSSPKPARSVREILNSRRSASQIESLHVALSAPTVSTFITSSYGAPPPPPVDDSGPFARDFENPNELFAGTSAADPTVTAPSDISSLWVADQIIITGSIPSYQEVTTPPRPTQANLGVGRNAIRPAGPAAPESWARADAERRDLEGRCTSQAISWAQKQRLLRVLKREHPDQDDVPWIDLSARLSAKLEEVEKGPKPLKDQCLLHLARRLESIDRMNLLYLPCHLKQQLLYQRNSLTMKGQQKRMKHEVFEIFVDRHLTDLDLACSDSTIETLNLFMPPPRSQKDNKPEDDVDRLNSKTQNLEIASEDLPESWEDLLETSTSSAYSDSDASSSTTENDHEISEAFSERLAAKSMLESRIRRGCPDIQVLDMSFTNPQKLLGPATARILAERLPFLSSLSVIGCFDAVTGPQTLTLLSKSLIHLVHLDMSYCDWLNDKVLMGNVHWEQCWRLMDVVAVIGCPLKHKSEVVEIMKRRKPGMYLQVNL
ncbi:hypothetical protein HDV05_007112 [Chytridiales sp. JEL 0842]|nr:hypothetical protein HDV05_007112 [Chytridiales sp. JEL 0842]